MRPQGPEEQRTKPRGKELQVFLAGELGSRSTFNGREKIKQRKPGAFIT